VVSRHAVLFAIALAASGCSRRTGPPPLSAPSKLHAAALPDFERPTLGGARIDTKALRGKVVVIKFFARYCEPCKYTLPEAERVHRELAGDVVVIGVSEDEDPRQTAALVSDHRLTFPVVHDDGHVLAGRYRVTEIPIAFVADRDGVVQWVGGPGMAPGDLERAIAAVR
jgi:cytochrome c biogenesis protein CcmG, thiol:disulfide interchange protein DsbE